MLQLPAPLLDMLNVAYAQGGVMFTEAALLKRNCSLGRLGHIRIY